MIIYDNHIKAVYKALRRRGLDPGRDVSVVGTDDMPWAAHVHPATTVVRVPRIRAVRMTWDMVQAVKDGNDPGIRYLETQLVVRESTGRINL